MSEVRRTFTEVSVRNQSANVEARVIAMYQQHPFPSIADKRRKADLEMPLRLNLLGIKPDDYIGKKVLDAGCGTGEYSCWYANQGSEVTAVDLCDASLERAAAYAKEQRIRNIAFEKQSVLKLNFSDASFDYVYSMGVLHHTPDPYGGFRELCRVLRPGGVIVTSLYNKFGRLRHNMKQLVVRAIAGGDIDRRVATARRLFPRTCRSLQKNRGDQSDIILYDAFGIPHESQHSVGELLRWFDLNSIKPLGAFGPITVRENLRALQLLRGNEFRSFTQFFDGYSLATRAVQLLPKTLGRLTDQVSGNALTFTRPSWFSRGLVQFAWFILGFRFSIFSLSGRMILPQPQRPSSPR
jgi:2-polyprenyl-3-methyl-5-hydroxy-6-metoxy-1,4-benzoquinol methylase